VPANADAVESIAELLTGVEAVIEAIRRKVSCPCRADPLDRRLPTRVLDLLHGHRLWRG